MIGIQSIDRSRKIQRFIPIMKKLTFLLLAYNLALIGFTLSQASELGAVDLARNRSRRSPNYRVSEFDVNDASDDFAPVDISDQRAGHLHTYPSKKHAIWVSEGLNSEDVDDDDYSIPIASKRNRNDDCLSSQNHYRRLHGVPELKLDHKLIEFARKRAWAITTNFNHDVPLLHEYGYGENLAWDSRDWVDCSTLIGRFYDEIRDYNFQDPALSANKMVGHFTQLIWWSTTHVGCAVIRIPKGTYLACNYAPAGNVMSFFGYDLYRKNVPPPRSQAVSTKPPDGRVTTMEPEVVPEEPVTVAPVTETPRPRPRPRPSPAPSPVPSPPPIPLPTPDYFYNYYDY